MTLEESMYAAIESLVPDKSFTSVNPLETVCKQLIDLESSLEMWLKELYGLSLVSHYLQIVRCRLILLQIPK